MGNLFKVISNKMSKPGFHPDLLPQVQSCSHSPKAASALLCSVFESKNATLAHPTAEIMFFFIIPIRNGPLGPLETVICMKGWRPGEGIVPAPKSRDVLPRGTVHQPNREDMPAQVWPCFYHFPRCPRA